MPWYWNNNPNKLVKMLYSVNDREFTKLISDKQDIIQARLEYAAPVMAAISQRWISAIEPSALVLLIWIFGRTIAYGKAADIIPIREFFEGTQETDEPHFAALPLGENTVRRHLKSLCDSDFLHVYRVVSGPKQHEKEARMFEINVKKLLDCSELESRNSRFLGVIQDRIIEEKGSRHRKNAGNRVPKSGTPPPNNGEGPSCNTYSDYIASENNRLGKPNQLLSPVFDAARVADTKNNLRNNMKELPVPKKVRYSVSRSDSIAEVLATTKEKTRAVAARRVAAAAFEINVKNLQALIDAGMSTYLPGLPRMIVTAKPFSVFKKRIQAAGVESIPKFIDYSIREWTSFAAQNRAAYLKDPSKRKNGAPLPEAPNFTSFAYRLPYFIAAYANNIASSAQPTKVSRNAEQNTLGAIKSRVAYMQKAAGGVAIPERRKRLRPAASPPITTPTRDDMLLDDWVPPVWGDRKIG